MKTTTRSHNFLNLFLALLIAGAVSLSTSSLIAQAQTVMTVSPALYNQSGQQVNNANTTPLPAGYYYLAPGAQQGTQVYYYGNGTYYNPSTGMYGGNVSNANGVAGYFYSGSTVTYPTVPNTGAGGEAAVVWFTLLASGLIATAGVVYLVDRRLTVRS